MRAATWAIPAPFLSNISPVENATNVGIIAILPKAADKSTPNIPLLPPIILDIVSGFNTARVKPTTKIMPKN